MLNPARILAGALHPVRIMACSLLLCIGMFACKRPTDKPIPAKTTAAHAAVQHRGKVPAVQPSLSDGDLVLRTGNDLISELFAQLNQQDKTFSHCGILMQDSGQWVVYHAIGGEENPDEHLRREPLEKFIGRDHNLGYAICRYPFSAGQQIRMRHIVDSLYRTGVRFDMQFDLASDDRLYCAEMVYKAFNKTLDTASFCETSMHRGFAYVSTDNLFLTANMKMLCHIVY